MSALPHSPKSQEPEEEANVWDDDAEDNLMALFVLDDIPTINEILYRNYERHDANIWPADTYDTIPDYDGSIPQVTLPLPASWRSPFVGKSVPEVVAFMRNVPKPPKPLNTRFCAILRQSTLDEGYVFICKSLKGEVRQEPQAEDEDDTAREDDLDTDSEVEEGHGPRFTRIMKARKAMINRRKRKERAERLPGKAPESTEKKTETKPKHEDDYEDIQLVPTSADRISLFLDGVEHERWDEYFCHWREGHNWIS